MSVKGSTDFQPVATSQGWFSWASWSNWFAGIFANIGSYFYHSDPSPLSDLTPLPKTVTYENLTRYVATNFTPKLALADRELTAGAVGKASKTITELNQMRELINAHNTPDVLINGYKWEPISSELAKVEVLIRSLAEIFLTYPPVPDVPPDTRVQPSFGLYNPHNNCFINATLQMVFAIPFLVENIVFGKGQNIMVRRAYQRFRELSETGNLNTHPDLSSELRGLNKMFAGSGQHDAPEFLMALLKPLKDNPLFFRQKEIGYYEGYMAHKAEISAEEPFELDGGRVKAGDPLSSLQLVLPSDANAPTMQELIHATFDETVITDDTVAFKSVSGEGPVRLKLSRKHVQIAPPDFLFVDLKRHAVAAQEFQGAGGFVGAKNSAQVSFQRTFYIPPEHDIQGVGAKYEWVALANQGGSFNGGHYVAYVATDNGKYYYYSDTTKSEKTEEQFLAAGKEFYLGFARRVDCADIRGEMEASRLAGKVDQDIGRAIKGTTWAPISTDQKEINLLKLFTQYLSEGEPSLQKLQKVYDLLPRSFHQFARDMLLKEPRDHLLELREINRELLIKRVDDKVATNIVAQYAEVRKQNLELARFHRGQLKKELDLLVMQKERLECLQTLEGPPQTFVAQVFEPGLEKLIQAKGIPLLLAENQKKREVITIEMTNARIIAEH